MYNRTLDEKKHENTFSTKILEKIDINGVDNVYVSKTANRNIIVFAIIILKLLIEIHLALV